MFFKKKKPIDKFVKKVEKMAKGYEIEITIFYEKFGKELYLHCNEYGCYFKDGQGSYHDSMRASELNEEQVELIAEKYDWIINEIKSGIQKTIEGRKRMKEYEEKVNKDKKKRMCKANLLLAEKMGEK